MITLDAKEIQFLAYNHKNHNSIGVGRNRVKFQILVSTSSLTSFMHRYDKTSKNSENYKKFKRCRAN